jgi:FeS assembly SUF system regulator
MTKQADYGIVLMTHLANEPGRRFAAPDLAEETQLPLPTVSKILKQLTREGLLESHRGAKGGYSLAREPLRITVADMITALDGPIAFTECIEDTPGACSQEHVCRLRGNWQRINLAVRQALESISLAELNEPLSPPLVQLGLGDGGWAAARPAD